jgi:hypothetical protein
MTWLAGVLELSRDLNIGLDRSIDQSIDPSLFSLPLAKNNAERWGSRVMTLFDLGGREMTFLHM